MTISRRRLIALATASAAVPRGAFADAPVEISWDDLIPPGMPYSEIIGDGVKDQDNDVWLPKFDTFATKLNPALDGAYIKMSGFMIPINLSAAGVSSFVLVPYVGACIHVPPPPPNQLVFVTPVTPWPSNNMWDAVWVTGRMQHEVQTTEVAQTGYILEAEFMEVFEW